MTGPLFSSQGVCSSETGALLGDPAFDSQRGEGDGEGNCLNTRTGHRDFDHRQPAMK